MLFYIVCMTDCAAVLQCIITGWITDFSLFFFFNFLYTSKVGKLKAIHIICKRDTESAKVAPESVPSNRVKISKVRT